MDAHPNILRSQFPRITTSASVSRNMSDPCSSLSHLYQSRNKAIFSTAVLQATMRKRWARRHLPVHDLILISCFGDGFCFCSSFASASPSMVSLLVHRRLYSTEPLARLLLPTGLLNYTCFHDVSPGLARKVALGSQSCTVCMSSSAS